MLTPLHREVLAPQPRMGHWWNQPWNGLVGLDAACVIQDGNWPPSLAGVCQLGAVRRVSAQDCS